MAARSDKVIIVREYRDKFGSEMPTRKLSRLIYDENKLLFKDIEDARYLLRYIEGKTGEIKRKQVSKSPYFKKEARPLNPYNLPESDEIEYRPYHLKKKKVLVLSDIHIPYHSISAINAAIDYAKKEKPDCILLNGDTIDFFGLSKFCKDPRKRNFPAELESFKKFIDVLKKQFSKAEIIFKVGNHEERYDKFLYQKANELVGVDEFELSQIIKARAEGIEFISDKRIINYYGLNIIHGHEFSSGFFSPVNVARGLYLRGKTSAMQGHNHQTSEHTESDMNGKITTTWSTGCLCELHPEYAPINKWNWGFAMLEATAEGFKVHNKRIYKGKVL